MNVHVFPSVKEMSQAAAMLIGAQVLRKPDSVLGFATGSSPIGTYQELIRLYQEKVVDFSKAISFNLDEYVQLPITHVCSYHAFMQVQLFDHVNLKNSHLPDGNAHDLKKECKRYDTAIAQAGGIDLQLLGIGHNGHIGFNEPEDRYVYGTQVVDLTESTIKANRRFFESESDVPRRAISLGIGGIMHSRHVVLVAYGEEKAKAVKGMVTGEMTPRLPASILRIHPQATILLDKAAASLL